MATQSLPQQPQQQPLSDADFEALQAEARDTLTRLRDLERTISDERNRRAVEASPYKIGDEVEIEAGGYGVVRMTRVCITDIEGTSWGSPRLYGRRVRKDGSLGVKTVCVYQKITKKVGRREGDVNA